MKQSSNSKKPTVFVGVSGGVDSSVSAALLRRRGYDVVGVSMKTWQPDFIECTWRAERRDAMRVCAALDIPFLTFDLEEEYKKGVADYMVSEYARGRTPNPDVLCNKHVKFGAFLRKALGMGADMVATGHYAQVRQGEDGFELHMGADKEKDQTYFLWTLGQEELSRTLFPVGGMEKAEVRRLAEAYGLPTAAKKDSQGVCLVGPLDMKEFLRQYVPEKEGDVLDAGGRKIGHHPGAHFFTLGERHGFTVTEKGTGERPYYVVAKDMERNAITVSHDPAASSSSVIPVTDAQWISGRPPEAGAVLQSRYRYRQELLDCRLSEAGEGTASFAYDAPQPAASGQSLVAYDGTRCLGGGIVA